MPARRRTDPTRPVVGINGNNRQVGNRLIDALPRAVWARVVAAGARVAVDDLRILHQPGRAMRHAWFPLDGCILVTCASNGAGRPAINVVGNEGMVGATLALGISESSRCAQVHNPGTAFRISASALRRELRNDGALRRLLNRYVHVLMLQSEQRQACSHAHRVEQRLASLLLMLHDRAGRTQLGVTQAALADMLGVRRVGISQVAGALQRRGFIRYSRGRLDVTDRAGLERTACACYRANRDNHRRWLG